MLQILNKKKGFTLIELLVVIAIIGILASIVLVSMGTARQSARDAVRKADMRQIVSAQQLFYNANSRFYTCGAAGADCGDLLTWPASIDTYMPKTPTDPQAGNPYIWENNQGDSTKFCAYTNLETGGYYTASHAGNFECTDVPTLADCCL